MRESLAALAILLLVDLGVPAAGLPSPAALAGWDKYVAATGQRIAAELDRGSPFLVEVHVECESVSLSRTIPLILRPIVAPFVNSIPRESLERTLLGIRAGTIARAKARR